MSALSLESQPILRSKRVYSSIEEERKSNMTRNNNIFRDLDFKNLCEELVEKKAASKRQKKIPVDLPSTLPLRTNSKAGSWGCISGCPHRAKDGGALARHVQANHAIPLTIKMLAPLGVGLCARCGNVYASIRGLNQHYHHCKSPGRLVSELVSGPFPRRCEVWWEVEQAWFPGNAEPCKDQALHWIVTYDDGVEKSEFFQLVSFDVPSVQSLPLSLVTHWKNLL